MDFRILGPLEVSGDGQTLDLGGAKRRAVLTILLLHPNEVVAKETLVDRIWGSRPPPTATKALQVHVSSLRKTLGEAVLETRAPGYLLRVESGKLDLQCFEALVAQAHGADPETASRLLREALSLWRGAPLADFTYEPFAQAEIARLEEVRLAALEDRIAADLNCGLEAQLVAELEGLVVEHPLREHLRGQLMLALYRSGRQAEALDVFREGRRLLAEELGLEPSESLKRLQVAILEHDPTLEPTATSRLEAPTVNRSVFVASRLLEGLDALLSLAGALSQGHPPRDLVVAHVAESSELTQATAALNERRIGLVERGIAARMAAFASASPGEDLVQLASQHEADLILLDGGGSELDPDTKIVLGNATCDVALLIEAGGPLRAGPILVPFGAAEHDWTALELGAWLARATGEPLRLIGAASDARPDGRDASRLLADASLIVQRTAGVAAEPLLASPGREGVTALAEGAGLLIIGFSERWRKEGLGEIRSEIASSPPAPTVFVRRGLRPGGLAPAETRTRFTWSLISPARP